MDLSNIVKKAATNIRQGVPDAHQQARALVEAVKNLPQTESLAERVHATSPIAPIYKALLSDPALARQLGTKVTTHAGQANDPAFTHQLFKDIEKSSPKLSHTQMPSHALYIAGDDVHVFEFTSRPNLLHQIVRLSLRSGPTR